MGGGGEGWVKPVKEREEREGRGKGEKRGGKREEREEKRREEGKERRESGSHVPHGRYVSTQRSF